MASRRAASLRETGGSRSTWNGALVARADTERMDAQPGRVDATEACPGADEEGREVRPHRATGRGAEPQRPPVDECRVEPGEELIGGVEPAVARRPARLARAMRRP